MKILVVDDDKRLTHLLQLVFESRGVSVTVANSGQQALECLKGELPEVILLDLVMPGMSGLDVCKQIQANPRTARIPIIVFTAKSSEEAQEDLMQAGAAEYLTKPIRPSALIKRIREVAKHPDLSLLEF
jgi:CheY-like chemotaxis protein